MSHRKTRVLRTYWLALTCSCTSRRRFASSTRPGQQQSRRTSCNGTRKLRRSWFSEETMINQGTAGIFVESGRTSALIEASLLSLGFSPLKLRDHEQSEADHSANQVTLCELIVADEARADAVRNATPHNLMENPRWPPVLGVLRDAGAPEDAVSHRPQLRWDSPTAVHRRGGDSQTARYRACTSCPNTTLSSLTRRVRPVSGSNALGDQWHHHRRCDPSRFTTYLYQPCV